MNEKYTAHILDDLAEIVAIPSVYSTPLPGAPYGADCLRALQWFVDKARSYGLKAEIVDGACAYAEVGGGEECIGVLGHLDVVPAGNGWASDPFKMIEEGGKVYGRGVGDDKGAVVVCLAALRELKETAAPLKRRVRLIVGADEERGSSCIRHYLETGNEVPVMSFVPDSEFPVINSEKGIAHMALRFEDAALARSISRIDGAQCQNAVPDRSTVDVIEDGPLCAAMKKAGGGSLCADIFAAAPAAETIVSLGARPSDFEIHAARGVTLVANGTAEHASTPEKGDSALWKMLGVLAAYNGAIKSKYIEKIFDYLCTPLASGKLGIYVDDPDSGDLTMCMSQAELVGDELSLVIDFRLPLGVTPESVAKSIDAKLGCKTEILNYHENLYIDKNTPLIKTLLGVYRRITGDMTEPLQTGGGTYARELPNAVAFGCTPVDLDINMHRADENFPVAQLFKNYEIYLAAMLELANL